MEPHSLSPFYLSCILLFWHAFLCVTYDSDELFLALENGKKNILLAINEERQRTLQKERDSEFKEMEEMLRSVTAELKRSQEVNGSGNRSNADGLETDSEGELSRLNRRTSSGEEEDVWTNYSPTELNPDLLLPLREESLFFQKQLSIARNTISEYSENILRQNEELESFKRKEEAVARSMSNEIGMDSFIELESLGIPVINMKDVLRSRPLLQSKLLAQFQSILDKKSRMADLQVASLTEKLQWWVTLISVILSCIQQVSY